MRQFTIQITYLLTFFVSNCWLISAPAQIPIGWRTNGTGRYPKATPPIEWSREKNVVWKTKMPDRSYGSPIVVGKRIFVVSDPAELLCVDATKGKILWQRSTSVSGVFGEKKAQRIANDWKKINDQRGQLQQPALSCLVTVFRIEEIAAVGT